MFYVAPVSLQLYILQLGIITQRGCWRSALNTFYNKLTNLSESVEGLTTAWGTMAIL